MKLTESGCKPDGTPNGEVVTILFKGTSADGLELAVSNHAGAAFVEKMTRQK